MNKTMVVYVFFVPSIICDEPRRRGETPPRRIRNG